MSLEEALADRFRRASYLYLVEGMDLDHDGEDKAISDSISRLGSTMAGFLDGKVSLATLKYRMDNEFVSTGCLFPPRTAVNAMRVAVMDIDMDEMSTTLSRLGEMPDDLQDAKGRLLDAEEFIERHISSGDVGRSFIEGFSSLLMCLWHLQAPGIWPLHHDALMAMLQREGVVGRGDPPQDMVDLIMTVRHLEDSAGAGRYDISRILPLIDHDLPLEEACIQGCIGQIRDLLEAGIWDRALHWCDLLQAFRPRSAEALNGRVTAYEGKGLHMMAVAEAEALVELFPEDLRANRRLLGLYKNRGMVAEHNREVRRFRALVEARKEDRP